MYEQVLNKLSTAFIASPVNNSKRERGGLPGLFEDTAQMHMQREETRREPRTQATVFCGSRGRGET